MTRKPWERELDNEPLTEKSDHIKVPGYTGTWYVVDKTDKFGPELFMLESEQDGDEAACLIVDRWGNAVWDGVYNDWDDLEDAVASNCVVFSEVVVNPFNKKKEWKIYREVGWKGSFG